MIVSHKHRFIFLKTNKTAGTSVEIALSKFCGPDDVIPPLIPEDEAKRAELGRLSEERNWAQKRRNRRSADALKLDGRENLQSLHLYIA